MGKDSLPALLPLVMTLLLLPVAAFPQDRAGIVTTLQGAATVLHQSTAEPVPLKFRDDVFVRDRIATGEQAFVRVLLGGKATVTAREHTVLTITEVPGTATINVASGRIAVAVSKDRMKPGEVVQIRTPNSIAAIRGTIVVAEVSGDRSVITVLRGLIDVTRIDPATGRLIGQPVNVSVRQSVTVGNAAAQPLPQPTTISSEAAKNLTTDFSVIPRTPPAASVAPVVAAAMAQAAADLAAVLGRPQGALGSTTSGGSASSGGRQNGQGSESSNRNGGGNVGAVSNAGSAGNPSAGSSGPALGNLGSSGSSGGNGPAPGDVGNAGNGGGISGRVGSNVAAGDNPGNGGIVAGGGNSGVTSGNPGASGGSGLALGNAGSVGTSGGNGLALGNAGSVGASGGNGLALGNAGSVGASGGTAGLGIGNSVRTLNAPTGISSNPSPSIGNPGSARGRR